MCGVAGLFDRSASASETELVGICRAMANSLAHRGPDDAGVWTDARSGIALGHRRLSIVDLSPLGHQPMRSSSGRFSVTYNGEIFNFRELRALLEARGSRFRGTSDTEVLLECVEHWGIEETLARLNGMFAFGLWDSRERLLFLARDRFGEKPLYFAELGSRIVFASELLALPRCPWSDWKIDRQALAVYFRDLCVPSPLAILSRVRKVPPGTFVSFAFDSARQAEIRSYWSPIEEITRSAARPFQGTFEDATAEADKVLGQAVRRRMVADVPLGALLSGGIDSSTVVALMSASADAPVRTFSIGVSDTTYDEAPYARKIARALGTIHTEHYVSESEIAQAVMDLRGVYDEPFADSSQVPTLLVSRIARHHVTVALTGDGGDELFGGYSRYDIIPDLWRRLNAAPLGLRQRLGRVLQHAPASAVEVAAHLSARLRMYQNRFDDADDLLARVSAITGSDTLETLYELMQMNWKDPCQLVLGTTPPPLREAPIDLPPFLVDAERLMVHDTTHYLTNDLLVKIDRAAMNVSLETRIPFLDPEVFKLAWSLPVAFRRSRGGSKRLLKAVLKSHLSPDLFERPKMGFSIPIGRWLIGPLRDWAEALLDETRLRREGFLDVRRVRSAWQRHMARQETWSHEIWAVLQFQLWYESFLDATADAV